MQKIVLFVFDSFQNGGKRKRHYFYGFTANGIVSPVFVSHGDPLHIKIGHALVPQVSTNDLDDLFFRMLRDLADLPRSKRQVVVLEVRLACIGQVGTNKAGTFVA